MFANHAHVRPAGYVKDEDATVDRLLRLLDDAGFEGAVCFAPFSRRSRELGIHHNHWLAEAIAPHPNLVGFGSLDPTLPAGDQVKEIVDLGFRGVKLHPPAQKFHIFGDWARSAYEALEEAHLVADFHTGMHWHRLRDYDPLLFDEIAYHYPDLRMVFEHLGGWHFYRQMIAVVVNNQTRGNHLYAGIASVLEHDVQRYWHLGAEGLEECRWQMGSDRLIYGLDFPFNPLESVQRDVATIRGMDWPAEEIEGVLGGNLKRLLGLQ